MQHLGQLDIVGPMAVPLSVVVSPSDTVTVPVPVIISPRAQAGSVVSIVLSVFGQVGAGTERRLLGTARCAIEIVR